MPAASPAGAKTASSRNDANGKRAWCHGYGDHGRADRVGTGAFVARAVALALRPTRPRPNASPNPEFPVRYTILGRTGMTVSRLALGCMSYGDPGWRPWVLDESAARPFFQRAIELGINFFDT